MSTNVEQDQTHMPAIKGLARPLERRIVRPAIDSALPDESRQRIILTMSATVGTISR